MSKGQGFCGLCGDYVRMKEQHKQMTFPNEKYMTSAQKSQAKIQSLDYYILLCKTCSNECIQGQSKAYVCAKKSGTDYNKATFYEKVAMLEKAREEEKLQKAKNAYAANYYKATNQKDPNLNYLNERLPNAPSGF